MGKSGKGIPEDWEDYTSISKQIKGTRFIAFKVPLKDALLNNLDVSVEFFDVNSLVEQCPNLGLVIDLTNTDRYYDPTEFRGHNISYYKLKTFGHFIPSDGVVFKFFEVVEGFLANNRNNGKLIGVHCTHGVNRTGYVIIRYMIQQLNMKPEEALSAFNTARGHKLEKENYLEDLKKANWIKPPKFMPRLRPVHRKIPQQEEPLYDEPFFDNGSYFEDDFMTRNPVMSCGPLLRERHDRREYEPAPPSFHYNCDRPRPFPVPLLPRLRYPQSHPEYLNNDYEDQIEHDFVDYYRSQSRRPHFESPSTLSVLNHRRLDYETEYQNNFYSQESKIISEQRQKHELNVRPLHYDPLPLSAYRRPIGEVSRLGKPYYEQRKDACSSLESDAYRREDRVFESRSLSSLLHDDTPQRQYESNIGLNASKLYEDDTYSQRTPLNVNPLMRERSLSLYERGTDLRLPLDPQRRAFSSEARNIYSSGYDFPPRIRNSRFLPY